MAIVTSIGLLIYFFVFVYSENTELLSVVTLYRHGSRAPIRMYKNDPYQKIAEEIWPNGLQQLTNIGIQQQFELGKWFRQHYADFIPETYNRKFIKIMSSNVDRCLMSAGANLAGLFPPKDNQIWNKNLEWQPIPIHTTPENEDALLAGAKPCPKFDKLFQNLLNSDIYHKYMKSNQHLIQYIKKHSGENITRTDDITLIHDALFVESYQGLLLPEWTHSIYPNFTLPFLIFSFGLPTYSPHLARLKSGPLLDYITTFLEDVIRKPNDSQKLLMLSTHDNTMTYLLNSLGLYDNTWIEYASVIIFELRYGRNQHFVNINFKNSTNNRQLILNKCVYDCNFDRFKKITEHLRMNPENWQNECFGV